MTTQTEPPGWLDIHAHFFVPGPTSADEALVAALRDAHFMMTKPPRSNHKELIAYCDRAGIDCHADAIEHTPYNRGNTGVK